MDAANKTMILCEEAFKEPMHRTIMSALFLNRKQGE